MNCSFSVNVCNGLINLKTLVIFLKEIEKAIKSLFHFHKLGSWLEVTKNVPSNSSSSFPFLSASLDRAHASTDHFFFVSGL